MPKFYCDYCDTYLTHNTPSVRKTHCNGRKHKENVKLYYQKWMEDQAQSLIDATTAAFMKGKLGKYPGNAIPPPQSLGGPPMRPMGPGGMGPGGMRPMPPMGPMGPMGPMPPGMPPGMMPGPPMMGPGNEISNKSFLLQSFLISGPPPPMMGGPPHPGMIGPPGMRPPMFRPPM